MRAVRAHFMSHRSHMLGCGLAALLVVAAIVFDVPVLAGFGALLCAGMMVGMLVSMGGKHRH